MPGIVAHVQARKPEIADLERDTLAAKLKRRRFNLGLRQKDAAPALGVGENTLVDWEREQSRPAASCYPAIIRFLDYEPWPEPATLGERLRAERLRRGLSIRGAASYLLIDEATFAKWERDARMPAISMREICDAFLAGR
ncbi:MAG TPA: hypothetical protein VI168_19035 [Croceibacterium sp.]